MIGGQSMLVVEDDSRTAAFVSSILRLAGFTCVEIDATTHEAEHHIRAPSPDFILVDLGLPELDGADFIRSARRSAFLNPILVIASATSDEDVPAALRAGADGYLFKEDLDVRLTAALRELG